MNYLEAITLFTRAGLALVPIQHGLKGPKTKHWQDKACAYTTVEDFGNNVTQGNLGLLHKWSGTCAIDIDDLQFANVWLSTFDIDLNQLINNKNSVQICSPSSNRGKLLYRMPDDLKWLPSKQINANSPEILGKQEKYKHAVIDFRCGNDKGTTVQDVIYGKHPDKNGVIDGDYTVKGDIFNIPTIPAGLLDVWADIIENAITTKAVKHEASAVNWENDSETLKMLTAIPADCTREEWIIVCYALVTIGESFTTFDMWSRTSSKYQAYETKRLWNGADVNGGVGIGSLIKLAKDYGYKPVHTGKDEITSEETANEFIQKLLRR